jgi:hypothetical protein
MYLLSQLEEETVRPLRKRDMTPATAEKLWLNVRYSKEGCWPWMANALDGYGKFYFPKGCETVRSTTPRRVAFVLSVRDLAAGESVEMTCGNQLCCRPEHMLARRGPTESGIPRIPFEKRERVVSLYQDGLSVTQISAKTGVPAPTVCRILKVR